MEVKTYRAKTMQEALAIVRRDLGPHAAILHTRDVSAGGVWGWMWGTRRIEVTASTQVMVPSRLPARRETPVLQSAPAPIATAPVGVVPSAMATYAAVQRTSVAQPPIEDEAKNKFRDELRGQLADLQTMVEDLCRRTQRTSGHEWPDSLFRLFTDLIDAEIEERLARELVERLRRDVPSGQLADTALLKSRVARMIEDEIKVSGPIHVEPGRRRVIALVGPTGVGKTTTLAKLAANFRLREKRKVGLITVDTYRIAAVEQLRTYADIIELPMEVVSTPREMREAVARMADLDVVLMDTAGRSPRDEVKLQELKAMLSEAAADEVHLVLSSAASPSSLVKTAEQFAPVGTTALALTKLDEVTGLGNLLSVLRSSTLPLSYLTDGQNVPDDIWPAEPRRLARLILGENE